MRCRHRLLGNGRGCVLFAANDERNLKRCLCAESLDGILELRAVGRAFLVVLLIAELADAGCY